MRKILIQLDTDSLPSTFDRVVAIDAGVEELFAYGGVTTANVTSLIHGAMFTRGPKDLKNTAVFIGGSDVAVGEALLAKVQSLFFGPLRVSVMMDSNGSNTTAAAAVLAAAKHLDFSQTTALILGGTGPVGQRAAQLLAHRGARIRIGTRDASKAERSCHAVRLKVPSANVCACATSSPQALAEAARDVQLVIATGAAGVQLLSTEQRRAIPTLQVAIDLNAVPPAGIQGIEVYEKALDQDGVLCYGAIGIGGMKMRIHRVAIERLFTSNDFVLDTEPIYEIGQAF